MRIAVGAFRVLLAIAVVAPAWLGRSPVLAQSSPAPPAPPAAPPWSPITQERLLAPEPGNWLHFRRTYDGWGYSPLARIDTTNVAKLEPVWTFATDVNGGHQSPPVVNDGYL